MGLSIIIAALNEGDEPVKTVKGIFESADSDFEIILINDGSDKWVDIPVKYKKGITLITHKERMGLPFCRDHGVSIAKYNNIVLFNARMRFYSNDWMSKMESLMNKNVNTLYCTTSVCEWEGDRPEWLPDKIYGANIHFTKIREKGYDILKPIWKTEKPFTTIDEIPCVLGANYFVKKDWYNYIKGFSGLTSYGGAEAYLSLKTWMAGGKCEVVSNIEIGNVYRDRKGYGDIMEDYYWNKVYTAFTLLSFKDANNLFYKIYDSGYTNILALRLLANIEQLMRDRGYYNQIKVKNINNLIIK